MKKCSLLILGLLLTCLLCANCGEKYDDALKANQEFVKVTKNYINRIEDAKDGEDVAEAMEDYAEDWKKLFPKMQELAKKYPELKDKKSLPEELKKALDETKAVGYQLGDTFIKTMKYMRDEKVQAAQKKMGEVMQGMKTK